jgi:cytoskeletal protein CcmA (bactofilin family)
LAPANGTLIQGSVGIGTADPGANKLQVVGNTTLTGNLTVTGTMTLNSLAANGNTTLGNAATDTVTLRGLVTLTDSSASYPLRFGADTDLFRGAANRLDLASGDSLNLVSGNLQVAATTVISSSRILTAANGTVAIPAYSFTNDTNSGLYLPAANTLGLAVDGLDAIRIDSAANVGIGVTKPNTNLHVKSNPPHNPLKDTGVAATSTGSTGYNAGYTFVPLHSGQVTQLATRGDAGEAATIKLYTDAGVVLATATVTTSGTTTWDYVNITPVTLSAGSTYVVATYNGYTYSYGSLDTPVTSTNIRILNSRRTASSSFPGSSSSTTTMYGQADITFVEFNAVFEEGNVGIGTTAPEYKFQVRLNTSYEGHITTTGTWASSSDSRVKKNVTTLTSSLDKILALRGVRFDQIDNQNIIPGAGKNLGFIAQEVEPIIPEIVDTDGNGYKSLQYASLTPVLVGAIQEQQSQISSLYSDLSVTSNGQINVSMNVSEEVLASLGYTETRNEIESAKYSLTDSTGKLITRISQFSQVTAAKIQSGLINTTNLIANNAVINKLTAKDLVSEKLTSNIISPLSGNTITINAGTTITGSLTVKDIQTTKVTTTELKADIATASTLYADNIISKNGSITDFMTQKISSLRDELKEIVTATIATQSAQTENTSLMADSANWSFDIASDSATLSGDVALTNNLVVGSKLTVNGDTQLGNAFISGTFATGEIAIKDNFIETTNTALYIQPSSTGSVHILGDTMVIADTGDVTINANLSLNGRLTGSEATFSASLFANLLNATEASISGKLAANEIETNQIKIATDSAQTIIAESGFAALATSSAEMMANATAGTATLPAGKTELIIRNSKLTNLSMVYLTPVGSTQNQVLYIKSKYISPTPTPEATESAAPASSFIIALDQALDQNIDINWWIIN